MNERLLLLSHFPPSSDSILLIRPWLIQHSITEYKNTSLQEEKEEYTETWAASTKWVQMLKKGNELQLVKTWRFIFSHVF